MAVMRHAGEVLDLAHKDEDLLFIDHEGEALDGWREKMEELEPFAAVWELAADYGRANVHWYTTAFVMLNPDNLQAQVRNQPQHA
eukprot:1194164-Prorocentrum_minimum.AAC.2